MLVVQPQAGHDVLRDQPRAEAGLGRARDAFVEDELQVLGTAQVQVVAEHLLEEQSAGEGAVEDLRPRELRLLEEELVTETAMPFSACSRG
jgi:hypothetical protein